MRNSLLRVNLHTKEVQSVCNVAQGVIQQVTEAKAFMIFKENNYETKVSYGILDNTTRQIQYVQFVGDLPNHASGTLVRINDNTMAYFLDYLYVFNISAGMVYKLPTAFPMVSSAMLDRRTDSKYLRFLCVSNYQNMLTIEVPVRDLYSLSCSIGQELYDNSKAETTFAIQTATSTIMVHDVVIKYRIPQLYALANNSKASLEKYSALVVQGLVDYAYTSYVTGLNHVTPKPTILEFKQLAKEVGLAEIVAVCNQYLNVDEDNSLTTQLRRFLKKQQYTAAEELLGKLPFSAEVYETKAHVAVQAGKYFDALQYWLKALEFEPANLAYINAVHSIQRFIKLTDIKTAEQEQIILNSYLIGVAKSFGPLVGNKDLSDFTIIINKQKIAVHKLFLRTSIFFDNLVSDDQENENTFTIDGVVPGLTKELLIRVLQYAYTRSVNLFGLNAKQIGLVVKAASLFGWEQLVEACEEFLLVKPEWFSLELFELASSFNCKRLQLVLSGKFPNAVPMGEFNLTQYEPITIGNADARGGIQNEQLELHGSAIRKDKSIELTSKLFQTGMVVLRNLVPKLEVLQLKASIQGSASSKEETYANSGHFIALYHSAAPFLQIALNRDAIIVGKKYFQQKLNVNGLIAVKLDICKYETSYWGFLTINDLPTINFMLPTNIVPFPLQIVVSSDCSKHGASCATIADLQCKVHSDAQDPTCKAALATVLLQPQKCSQCNNNFVLAENNSHACYYHPGYIYNDGASMDSDNPGVPTWYVQYISIYM